jgi:hypothetical protein
MVSIVPWSILEPYFTILLLVKSIVAGGCLNPGSDRLVIHQINIVRNDSESLTGTKPICGNIRR